MCANVSPCPLQGKGRKRGFEIVRTPDLKGSSFLFNNVRVRYVGTCPETGISFYVNNGQGGVVGVRVYRDGRKVLENPGFAKPAPGSKRTRKEGYVDFKDAFGHHKGIFAAHAVYIAWHDKEIPAGMTIDHIDGCAANNDCRNLRCVSDAVNRRDGGFLRKLRNKGFDTSRIDRSLLLRYYDRMAKLKPIISKRGYERLTRDQLSHILYDPDFSIPV